MQLRRPTAIVHLEQLKEAAHQARLAHEREAWLNVAFYLGQQYVTWGDNTLVAIPRRSRNDKTPRPVVNKIMHYVQQELAEVLRDLPQPDVLPPTDDMTDVEDANVARAYLQHVADPVVTNWDAQVETAALNAIVCCQSYLKWCWNAGRKQPEIIPVPFFEGYPDPYAADWTKWRYFIHAQFMDTEQVYDKFGIEVPAAETHHADDQKTALMQGMGSTSVLSGVTVNEVWFRPSRRYPKGRYAVWAGNRFLVEPTEHPYNHRRIPFTLLGALKRPDSQFFQSPVEFLRPAQMELNKYHAQRIAIRERHANPKWWIPKDLTLDEDPNDDPGQILRGDSMNGQIKPEYIQPPHMPDNQDGEWLEQQMMHIVGLHEVSQAQVPGRVEAAKAIELLKEADANRTATLRKTVSQSTSEGGFQLLELARQFEKEETMVLAYSREGVPEVKRFRARDLRPGFRVRTTMTTGLARSRTAKQDAIFRLIELGVLTDQQLIAEQLDMPLPTFMHDKAMDVKLARNENYTMAKGDAVTANSWDDHQIHLREHNAFRKTQEFLLLGDDVKSKFEFHAQHHQEMLDADMMKQAELMAAAQPVTGGKAPAPPPAEGAPA